MSIKYVADIYFDVGEKVHICSKVRPVCGEDIPFAIKSAKYELYRRDDDTDEMVLEADGDVTIEGHVLDVLIQPKQTGRYRLKYIYVIADETWVDVVQLRVN